MSSEPLEPQTPEEKKTTPVIGHARSQEALETGTRYIYRKVPEGDLGAHFIFPRHFDYERDRLAVIVFLHGGKWDISAPNQFIPHCHHFASRSMVAVTAEYRTKALYDGGPLAAMEDARELMLFMKKNAHEMGIDAGRIILCGAGAGGHAALSATLEKPMDDQPSPRPNALALFSPISDTASRGLGVAQELFPSFKIARATSPQRHLPQKGLPPCLIFHGTDDRVVPYDQSEKLNKLYRKRGNPCELMGFTGAGHTFFNYNTGDGNYEITIRALDHFLVHHGVLPPDPHGDLEIL